MQRSVSVTPPPMPSSPPTTPGPSILSSTSRTSSKRPHTPGDDSDSHDIASEVRLSLPRPRKRRSTTSKGWKGWVGGSPPPSENLTKLDDVQVLEVRERARSRCARHWAESSGGRHMMLHIWCIRTSTDLFPSGFRPGTCFPYLPLYYVLYILVNVLL